MLNTLWLGFRSALFMIFFVLSTIVYGLLTPLLYFVPYPPRMTILISWAHLNIHALRYICGVKYRILNPQHLQQSRAHVVLANHQSTWETMFLPMITPLFAWVLKRELFKVPFFGWALHLARPIGIDRSAGRSAIEQIKEKGTSKLKAGTWIIMFPEGTRVLPGKKVRYKLGGAILATHSGFPVLPIAHNAGDSWPRHSFIKRPGTITVSVGAPISSEGKTAEALIKEVQSWIENEKQQLPPFRPE